MNKICLGANFEGYSNKPVTFYKNDRRIKSIMQENYFDFNKGYLECHYKAQKESIIQMIQGYNTKEHFEGYIVWEKV